MTEATKQAALSALRSVLMVMGSVLAANGVIQSSELEAYIGMAMTVTIAIWGVWDKYAEERKTKAREVVAVNAGIKVADATIGATPLVNHAATPAVIEQFTQATPEVVLKGLVEDKP